MKRIIKIQFPDSSLAQEFCKELQKTSGESAKRIQTMLQDKSVVLVETTDSVVYTLYLQSHMTPLLEKFDGFIIPN